MVVIVREILLFQGNLGEGEILFHLARLHGTHFGKNET